MSFKAEDEIPRSAELVEQFNILDMSIDQEDQVKGFIFWFLSRFLDRILIENTSHFKLRIWAIFRLHMFCKDSFQKSKYADF